MVTIGEKWKKLFWGCMGAVAVLVLLGLTLRVGPRGVHVLPPRRATDRVAGETTCPKCGKSVTFQ